MILLEFGSQSFMFAGELVLRAVGCIVARINKFSLSWWREKEDKERFFFRGFLLYEAILSCERAGEADSHSKQLTNRPWPFAPGDPQQPAEFSSRRSLARLLMRRKRGRGPRTVSSSRSVAVERFEPTWPRGAVAGLVPPRPCLQAVFAPKRDH